MVLVLAVATLCEQFQPSLQRGSIYTVYLHRIGQFFFGELLKQTSFNGGSPENLLSRLMGSSEQKEGEESQDDSSLIELHTSCLGINKMPMDHGGFAESDVALLHVFQMLKAMCAEQPLARTP
ncbi:hypothetical protein ACRRTK_008091 [Alexandromys fortis]